MLGQVTLVQVAMASMYGAAAVVYVVAATVWVYDYLNHCRRFAERPDGISPFDSRTLGFAGAAAAGMLVAIFVDHAGPGMPWTQLVFTCIMLGLAFNCLQYLLRWRGRGASVTAYVLVAALGAGAAIAP